MSIPERSLRPPIATGPLSRPAGRSRLRCTPDGRPTPRDARRHPPVPRLCLPHPGRHRHQPALGRRPRHLDPGQLEGLVVMVLLAYTIFTTTLVLQRKQAARGLALGLASLTIPLVPLLALSRLHRRGDLRRGARAAPVPGPSATRGADVPERAVTGRAAPGTNSAAGRYPHRSRDVARADPLDRPDPEAHPSSQTSRRRRAVQQERTAGVQRRPATNEPAPTGAPPTGASPRPAPAGRLGAAAGAGLRPAAAPDRGRRGRHDRAPGRSARVRPAASTRVRLDRRPSRPSRAPAHGLQAVVHGALPDGRSSSSPHWSASRSSPSSSSSRPRSRPTPARPIWTPAPTASPAPAPPPNLGYVQPDMGNNQSPAATR